jgi:hypothetical protein
MRIVYLSIVEEVVNRGKEKESNRLEGMNVCVQKKNGTK